MKILTEKIMEGREEEEEEEEEGEEEEWRLTSVSKVVTSRFSPVTVTISASLHSVSGLLTQMSPPGTNYSATPEKKTNRENKRTRDNKLQQ